MNLVLMVFCFFRIFLRNVLFLNNRYFICFELVIGIYSVFFIDKNCGVEVGV